MSPAGGSAPLRVVALTRTGPRGPSTRYRIEQYRPELARLGIEVETRPLFGDSWFRILEVRNPLARTLLKVPYSLGRLVARLAQALAADRAGGDLVLIEQQLFPYLPWFVERLFWPRHTPVLLEFDDAIWLTFAHEAKLRAACARASLVLVGNEELARFAHTSGARVAVVPTVVDAGRYAPVAERPPEGGPPERPLRVGWIGLRYNLAYLEQVAAPLARLGASGRPCELRVISSGAPAPGPAWSGVPVVHRPWSEATEADEIAACDVGIMPLPDDAWARGKCGLKLLQFMAAGRPVVASPVGVNPEIVREGQEGLLAADEAGWEHALRRLCDDPGLRIRLGRQARLRVVRDYALASWAPRLAETYRLASRPAARPAP